MGPKNLSKMEPKSSPRGVELGFENVNNSEVDFELNLAPTWLQLGPREAVNEPRPSSLFLILGPSWTPRPSGTPKLSIFDRFGIDFGSIFDRFLMDFLIDSSDVIVVVVAIRSRLFMS